MLTGTKKRYPSGSTVLSFGNGTHTVDEVTGAMQTLVTLRTTVEAAENATTVALDAERTTAPSLLVLIAGFTKFVRATFGTSADALADFDLAPPKVPAPEDGGGEGGLRREGQGHPGRPGHDQRQAEEEREGQHHGDARRDARHARSCSGAGRDPAGRGWHQRHDARAQLARS